MNFGLTQPAGAETQHPLTAELMIELLLPEERKLVQSIEPYRDQLPRAGEDRSLTRLRVSQAWLSLLHLKEKGSH